MNGNTRRHPFLGVHLKLNSLMEMEMGSRKRKREIIAFSPSDRKEYEMISTSYASPPVDEATCFGKVFLFLSCLFLK